MTLESGDYDTSSPESHPHEAEHHPHRREAGHQVDSALQLETQFCSNDSTWNTLPVVTLALLPGWKPGQ